MTTEASTLILVTAPTNPTTAQIHCDMGEAIEHLRRVCPELQETPDDLVDTARKIAELNRQRLVATEAARLNSTTTPLGPRGSTAFVAYFAQEGLDVELLERADRLTWQVTLKRASTVSEEVFQFKQLIGARWLNVIASHRPAVDMHTQGVSSTPIAAILRQQ